MLKLKMKSQRGRAGRRRGARVSTVDCARSPYGESTFKRNRPSFAVLMVLGGGGGIQKGEFTQKGELSFKKGSLLRRGVIIQKGELLFKKGSLLRRGVIIQCHLFISDKTKFRSYRCKNKLLGQISKPTVDAMSSPGSYLREGVSFSMLVPRRGSALRSICVFCFS